MTLPVRLIQTLTHHGKVFSSNIYGEYSSDPRSEEDEGMSDSDNNGDEPPPCRESSGPGLTEAEQGSQGDISLQKEHTGVSVKRGSFWACICII